MKEDWEVLRRCSLFQGLTETEVTELCDCLGCRRATYRRGELLWMTGDRVEHCGVVLSGRICAENLTADGRRTIVASHGPGSVFGDALMSLPDMASPSDIVAMEKTAVLFIPFEALMGGCARCCAAHTVLRQNLLAEMSKKFWDLRQRLGYLSTRSLRARLARFLLGEAARYGADTFSLTMSREELADVLCVNRSALSRELGRMGREGLVECYRDSFKLLDQSALHAAAE